MSKGMHCFVEGQVQGVCFRMETERQALLLGLTGWVRNLPDGRVEVLACGEQQHLDQLRDWLKKGPGMAQVLKWECETIDYEDFDSFTTAY